MTVKISKENKKKAAIAFRFFVSKCRETVQTSARNSTQSFFDMRMKNLGEMLDRLTTIVGSNSNIKRKMLGEILGEMLDRLTTIVWSNSNIKRKMLGEILGKMLDRLKNLSEILPFYQVDKFY